MLTDLHLTDRQYLIALTVFFFPYALFQVCLQFDSSLVTILTLTIQATQQYCAKKTSSGAVAFVCYGHLGHCHGKHCENVGKGRECQLLILLADAAWCCP